MNFKEMYPEGRHFYWEGHDDELDSLFEKLKEWGIEPSIQFDIPAERLDEFYASPLSWKVGT